jgi:hypothetical protein
MGITEGSHATGISIAKVETGKGSGLDYSLFLCYVDAIQSGNGPTMFFLRSAEQYVIFDVRSSEYRTMTSACAKVCVLGKGK